MNTVEWARDALIRCRGLLSPEREYRFRLLRHPFVNEDADLEIQPAETTKLPNRAYHMDVWSLKSTEKKLYMSYILGKGMWFMTALSECMGSSRGTSAA